MIIDNINRKIDLAQQRLNFLLDQNRTNELLLQPELLATILEELSISIEELHVQHQEILETRHLLEIERQKYQDLFELAPDSYLITDSLGIIKKINHATESLLNAPYNVILNKPLATFISKIDRTNFRNKLNELPDLKKVKDWEITLKPYQINEFPAVISVSTIVNLEGKIDGFRWQIRDQITCKKNELELIQAKEKAEAANLAKECFLAIASHEIRTPITAILGFCTLLLNTRLSKKQKQWLETMEQSTKTLLNIINDILDFVKIETGKIQLESHVFNLNICIREVLRIIKLEADKKGLNLTFYLGEYVPLQIKGDSQKLQQILINLLNNAIKFTEKGEINLSVQVIQNSDKITLEFAIKDTGIGIRADKINHLFTPFTQVDSSISRQYGGTGLGLAICQKLIKNMGGKIWVDSKINQGSTFYFTIISDNLESNGQEEANFVKTNNVIPLNTIFSEKQPNILVVEDENSISEVLLSLFNEMGINIDIVRNGLEAVQSYDAKFYDLIFMDLSMPIMNGLEATKLIRQQEQKKPSLKKTKIIGLTANIRPEIKENCLHSGMDDYISKPFDLQDLLNLLEKL